MRGVSGLIKSAKESPTGGSLELLLPGPNFVVKTDLLPIQ